jgi:pyruvate formate lyase activating enzyme
MRCIAPIFNVQSLSTQDGPGLRTAVFFQGCPLRCTWCSNPEGQSALPQLQWQESRCVGCLECTRACSGVTARVKSGSEKKQPRFDRAACRKCAAWRCLDTCPGGALQRIGRPWSREDLLAVIKKDMRLYRNSGGGVTFTGGEPLMHSEFLGPIARELQDRAVHVAIETCGFWEWADAAECLRHCDLVYFDVKTLDDVVHRRFTGCSNGLILQNLRKLAESRGDRVVVSIPVVPGVLDSAEAIGQIGDHILGLGLKRARLLPYHSLGRGKYAALGLRYPHEPWDGAVDMSVVEGGRARLAEVGLGATIEGWV